MIFDFIFFFSFFIPFLFSFILTNHLKNKIKKKLNKIKLNILKKKKKIDIPAINSLESCYLDLERPIMFRELKRIEKRVGNDVFPVISQTFYSNSSSMVLFDEFPAVMKCGFCFFLFGFLDFFFLKNRIFFFNAFFYLLTLFSSSLLSSLSLLSLSGAAHAGQGKILMNDMQTFRDMQTVMTLYDDYATVEPFIKYAYGIRVQKVGPSVTVLKKHFTGSGWKVFCFFVFCFLFYFFMFLFF